MHRRKWLGLLGILALTGAVAGLAMPRAWAAGKAGGRAPNFTLKGADGKEVQLSALKGKVVFVDFWASWCKPCKKEMPALDKMAKDYAGKDVVILAINIDTERENADKFLKSAKVKHLTVLYDPSSTSAEQYEPPTMPTSYVIDKKGIIKHVNAGYSSGDEKKYRKQIDALLAAK